MEALKKHPEALEKIGCGVDSIFVKDFFYFGKTSYCFHIKRIDGSEECFSYQMCWLDPTKNSYISYLRYLSHKDKVAVMEALKKHPEASEKIGCGINSIFFKEVFYHGMSSYCFHIKRVDGSEEYFGYHSCLGCTLLVLVTRMSDLS